MAHRKGARRPQRIPSVYVGRLLADAAGELRAVVGARTQLLTVSSSIQNPITTGGRVLDVAMELYAITVISTLAGSVGSFMLKRAEERDHDDLKRA